MTLYDHDPEWNKEAARTIKTIKDILGDVAIQAEHVGSTSVNSIKAKPIIDIAVAVIHFSDIIRYNRNSQNTVFIIVTRWMPQALFCAEKSILRQIISGSYYMLAVDIMTVQTDFKRILFTS